MGRVLLPDDDLLREELAFAKYDVGSSPLNRVPKKSLPHSPNRSDVSAVLFWELPEPDAKQSRKYDGRFPARDGRRCHKRP